MESGWCVMHDRKTFHILALDGGGIRGVYTAHLLARLEDALQAPVRERFDLIAGTSSGAILAGAAAMSVPMERLAVLFEAEASRIFNRRWLSCFSLVRSRYSTEPLVQVLSKYLPEVTLGEVPSPLMITSSDISTGQVHVFKSRYLEELGHPYRRDGDVRLSDAVLASCAAPAYFDPRQVREYLLADGGLWANNPSVLAITEALSRFGRPIEQVHVLSIGTGRSPSFYRKSWAWGLLTGWGREQLVSYVLGLQSQASANMAELLLGERHLRLDPEIQSWRLDDTKRVQNLKALADSDFSYCSEAILANLEGIR